MQVTELVASDRRETIGYSVRFYPNEPWKMCGAHLEHINELHSEKIQVTHKQNLIHLCHVPACHEKMVAEVNVKTFFTAVMLKNEISAI